MAISGRNVAATPPVAVDVTGMAPQLDIIRRDAAERGWQATCEGRAGEEGVLRLSLPAWSEGAVRSYFGRKDHIGSSTRFYFRDDMAPDGCDQEPITTSASRAARVLAIGPRDALTPLAKIARACGFALATVRERRQNDLPEATAGFQDDWLTLDAGEDATPRYGPSICFLQMQSRALGSTDR